MGSSLAQLLWSDPKVREVYLHIVVWKTFRIHVFDFILFDFVFNDVLFLKVTSLSSPTMRAK